MNKIVIPEQLRRTSRNSHKSQYGHVLLVAGSPAMLGASVLAANAAMRSGAGLVTAAVPRGLNATMQGKLSPVVMTMPLKETSEGTFSAQAFEEIEKALGKYTVLAIGPGASQNAETQDLFARLIESCPLPLVIDADGIGARNREALLKAKAPRILTPHMGEMRRLSGLDREVIEQDRRKAALDFARDFRCVIVLKGDETIVAGADGSVYLNTTGNPGMSTAGSGDVLTGVIAALLAQSVGAFEAAKTATYLHGLAGDLAVERIPKASLIATDIIDWIPQAIAVMIDSTDASI